MASLLEKSLSLSESGGIYYAGARVKTKSDEAVLYVGLGGSGADALIRIKNEVVNRTILPTDEAGVPTAEVPAGIGFLEVDTDVTTKELTYGAAHFDKFGTEYCDISVADLPGVIEAVKKQKDLGVECWQWFGKEVNAIAGKKGAGGIRQIGRLLLAYNMDAVVDKVKGKIRQLTTNNNINSLTIFLFSGISGGTGAGTFLDMAYILRKIGRSIVPNVNILGYLIMTDVNELNGGEIDTMRANGFACLKELDYWMASGEHSERYVQKFPGKFELNEYDKPFDFCHLMDASDQNSHNFTYSKILSSVAEHAFVYMAGEAGGGAGGNTAMTQMYNNINTYMTSLSARAVYPANHTYLSIGTAKLEIPYTEISTLIAARVFQHLGSGMFQNRPTKEQINLLMAKELQLSEQNIRSELYRNVPARPELDSRTFKYADIWPSNRPYVAADQWLASFQRFVTQNAGALPDDLEGRLKHFIQTHLEDDKTGPIYLAHALQSNEATNIRGQVKAFRKYCDELSAQCGARSETLKAELQNLFASGKNAGVFGRGDATEKYLKKLEEWEKNEEGWFLNKKITEILDQMLERLDVYYSQILKPLADTLNALPPLFDENEKFIRVQAEKGSGDFLIDPLAFEKTNQAEFSKAVEEAEKNFLTSMSDNIRRLIGKTIDQVDDAVSSGIDVAGFISWFISKNFQKLLTINMEKIMISKLKPAQTLKDYVYERTKELIANSYPMYRENGSVQVGTEVFGVISVPNDCPQLLVDVNNYLKNANLSQKIIVKTSEEKSRFYIVKVESGFPLFENEYIDGMERSYEAQMTTANVGMGKHLKPEWADRLPSPYVQPAWRGVYSCARTKNRNDRIRKAFQECVDNQVIVEDPVKGVVLKKAAPQIADRLGMKMLTGQDLPTKRKQLDQIRQDLWKKGDVIELKTYGVYLLQQENGRLKNAFENALRFPELTEEIEKEDKIAEKLDEMNRQLQEPSLFAYALAAHMIKVNEITGDAAFYRSDNDPLPQSLTVGSTMSLDFQEYQIYSSFCGKLNRDMTSEINSQFDSLRKRIVASPVYREQLVKEVKQQILPAYQKQYDLAYDKLLSAALGDREHLQDIVDFYKIVADELKDRVLPRNEVEVEPPVPQPDDASEKGTDNQGPANDGGPAASFRYLDPDHGWVPVASPADGQKVFDTQTQQLTVYRKEVPKAARYLDPANGWKPVEPVEEQQVFDTQKQQMIIYHGEAGTPGRFLDPASGWKPVIPVPGMQVFDTQKQQMITYYPGYENS